MLLDISFLLWLYMVSEICIKILFRTERLLLFTIYNLWLRVQASHLFPGWTWFRNAEKCHDSFLNCLEIDKSTAMLLIVLGKYCKQTSSKMLMMAISSYFLFPRFYIFIYNFPLCFFLTSSIPLLRLRISRMSARVSCISEVPFLVFPREYQCASRLGIGILRWSFPILQFL